MVELSFPIPRYTLPIFGRSDITYPVHRIFCVAQNYAAHAAEMGNTLPQAPDPVFFLKPPSALVYDEGCILYPPNTADLQHEVELVVALSKGGTHISEADAGNCIFGYAVGLDMTCRDIQAQAKASGRPWTMAKGFDTSAPMSAIRLKSDIGELVEGVISCAVNGEVRQLGNLRDQCNSVNKLISSLSQWVQLEAGDLVMTGTPSGVGPCLPGDKITGYIEKIGYINVSVITQN